jgi:hypothetical protein
MPTTTSMANDFNPSAPVTSKSSLLSLNHLTMVWNNESALHPVATYRFEDQGGILLGEAKGEAQLPLGLSYILSDSNNQPVLMVNSERARLMSYNYFIRDAQGNTIVSLKIKSSFMGRKYSLTQNNSDVMLLTTDASATNQKIVDNASNSILATGARDLGFTKSKVTIDISETQEIDHRIVLGALIFVNFMSANRGH